MISAQYPTAVFIKHDDEVLGAITGSNLLVNCSRNIMYRGMSHQLTNFLLCRQEGSVCLFYIDI